jgi:hypothetical protein
VVLVAGEGRGPDEDQAKVQTPRDRRRPGHQGGGGGGGGRPVDATRKQGRAARARERLSEGKGGRVSAARARGGV